MEVEREACYGWLIFSQFLVRQVATICLFANAEYKCTVAELESS